MPHHFIRIHAEFVSTNEFLIDVFLVSLTHERRFLSSKSCSSLETLAANSPDGWKVDSINEFQVSWDRTWPEASAVSSGMSTYSNVFSRPTCQRIGFFNWIISKVDLNRQKLIEETGLKFKLKYNFRMINVSIVAQLQTGFLSSTFELRYKELQVNISIFLFYQSSKFIPDRF